MANLCTFYYISTQLYNCKETKNPFRIKVIILLSSLGVQVPAPGTQRRQLQILNACSTTRKSWRHMHSINYGNSHLIKIPKREEEEEGEKEFGVYGDHPMLYQETERKSRILLDLCHCYSCCVLMPLAIPSPNMINPMINPSMGPRNATDSIQSIGRSYSGQFICRSEQNPYAYKKQVRFILSKRIPFPSFILRTLDEGLEPIVEDSCESWNNWLYSCIRSLLFLSLPMLSVHRDRI